MFAIQHNSRISTWWLALFSLSSNIPTFLEPRKLEELYCTVCTQKIHSNLKTCDKFVPSYKVGLGAGDLFRPLGHEGEELDKDNKPWERKY